MGRIWTCWWMLPAALLLLSGCNKAKSILEEAESAHEAGDPVGAAEILERMVVEAPGAPEQTRAALLAVRWLTEAEEATEDPGRRRELLHEALEWESDNARTRTALCRLEFDLEDWDAARSCVDEGREVIPTDRLQRFDELLARRDREAEQAVERGRLLASADPADWRRLRRRYGASPEASLADDKLMEASICEDLFRFTEPLKLKGSGSPTDWGERLGREDDRNGQVTVLTEVRDEAERLATSLADTRAALKIHGALPGEEEIQRSLLAAYASLEPPLGRLQRAFGGSVYKVEDRTDAVVRFGCDMRDLVFSLRDARKGAEQTCDDLREAAREVE